MHAEGLILIEFGEGTSWLGVWSVWSVWSAVIGYYIIRDDVLGRTQVWLAGWLWVAATKNTFVTLLKGS